MALELIGSGHETSYRRRYMASRHTRRVFHAAVAVTSGTAKLLDMVGRGEPQEPVAGKAEVLRGSPRAAMRLGERTLDPTTFLLGCALWLGFLVRIYAVSRSDFPLWDGGLFLTMTQDLEAHHFALPLYTSYNAAHIPFAYPPLAFYLLGAAHSMMGLSLVQMFRWFPLVVSLLSIGAFIGLARILVNSPTVIVAATFAFALLPDALYFLSGGGVARSLGLLFSLLLLRQVVLLCRTGDRFRLVLCIVFAGLTFLSHLEWAFFAAYSSALLFLSLDRTRRGLLHSAVLAVGVALLTAPWWVVSMQRHGISTYFTTISGTSSVFPWYAQLLDLITLHVTDEPLGGIATGLCLLGMLLCLVSRRWLLPMWLLAIFLLESRGSAERRLIVVALLIGIAVEDVLLPLLRGEFGAIMHAHSPQFARGAPRKLVPVVLTITVALAVLYALIYETTAPTAVAVTQGDRAAMSWVSVHTPVKSRVLVLTGKQWYVDNVEEWFPSLSRRIGATTVQGYEWIPGGLSRQASLDKAAQECVYRRSRCIELWISHFRQRIDYVYVSRDTPDFHVVPAPPDPCSLLCSSLDSNSRYAMVYSGRSARIYRRA